jgi:hypothetical protein
VQPLVAPLPEEFQCELELPFGFRRAEYRPESRIADGGIGNIQSLPVENVESVKAKLEAL